MLRSQFFNWSRVRSQFNKEQWKVWYIKDTFPSQRTSTSVKVEHRKVGYIPDLPLVIDSLLSLGAAILNIF